MNSVVQFTLVALALGCVGNAFGFCPAGMVPISCEDAVGAHTDAVIEAVSSIESAADLCGAIAGYYDDIVGYAIDNGMIPADAAELGCEDLVGTYVAPAVAELPPLEDIDISAAEICENLPPVVTEVAVDILVTHEVITLADLCVAA